MTKKQYITQITQKDLEEISQACNLTGVGLVKVVRQNGKTELVLDESAFKVAIYAFYKNGGLAASSSAAASLISLAPPD